MDMVYEHSTAEQHPAPPQHDDEHTLTATLSYYKQRHQIARTKDINKYINMRTCMIIIINASVQVVMVSLLCSDYENVRNAEDHRPHDHANTRQVPRQPQ